MPKYFFILVLLVELAVSERKRCHGTSNKFTLLSHIKLDRYEAYRKMYKGCNIVTTNVEITHLEKPGVIDFLDDIEEVLGYVLVEFNSYPNNVSMKNLKIIRGSHLFRNLSFRVGNNGNLERIYMPKLREIFKGGVEIVSNQKLCFMDTINWNEVLYSPASIQVKVENNADFCPSCDLGCMYENKLSCWDVDVCQSIEKLRCRKSCNTGCPANELKYCCHIQCIGGCYGIQPDECLNCRNFNNTGMCVEVCPDVYIYDPVTMRQIPNPAGRYSLKEQCVKECPTSTVISNGHCLQNCPPGYQNGANRMCKECDEEKGCPKTCNINPNWAFSSKKLRHYENCTLIAGPLKILNTTINRDDLSILESLSKVQEITGYLTIQGQNENFRNLSFLRNLKIIRGQRSKESEQNRALSISVSTLEDITFPNLETIEDNGLQILMNNNLKNLNFPLLVSIKNSKNQIKADVRKNPQLCYVSKQVFESIARGPVNVTDNRDPLECEQEGKICHSECFGGCWGEGDERCKHCKNYIFEGRCVASCKDYPNLFQMGNECVKCDAECEGGCTGFGPDRCKSCKHARHGSNCLKTCPHMMYQDDDGLCMACALTCKNGCSGSNDVLGDGGCFSCHLLFHETNTCIDSNEDVCDSKHYRMHEKLKVRRADGNATFETLEICKLCHPVCDSCLTGGTTDDVCKCKFMSYQGSCVKECPPKHFVNSFKKCLACDVECEDCYGSEAHQCFSCEKMRLYHSDMENVTDNYDEDESSTISFKPYHEDPMNRTRRSVKNNDYTYDNASVDNFTCVSVCPKAVPFEVETDFGNGIRRKICSTVMQESSASTFYKRPGVFVVVFSLIGMAVIVAIVGWVVMKRQRMVANTKKLEAEMQGLNIQQIISPSNTKPDHSFLRLINEYELKKDKEIGSGAFGTVYKGIWSPEKEKLKVVVAIKVLVEGSTTCQQNELLEEARVMASVTHPCCIKIMAVCMARQLMLVTPLIKEGSLLDFLHRNSQKLGSHTMLNWSAQIAKGMNYLEQKGIVHRDLAARNILVKSLLQVVITDFGLAKILNSEEQYKATEGKLPIKWLALESIQHLIFTHKSDVWSYGVTLWELFTGGQKPFEKIKVWELPAHLERGERLPQPAICTIDVYMLMVKCWLLHAETRPSFHELEQQFSTMATDPGRFLVVEGDKYGNSISEESENFKPLISFSGSEFDDVITAEDYLDPFKRSDWSDGRNGLDMVKEDDESCFMSPEAEYQNTSRKMQNEYTNSISSASDKDFNCSKKQESTRKPSLRYQKAPGKFEEEEETDKAPRLPSMDEKKLMMLEQQQANRLVDSQEYLLTSPAKQGIGNPEYLDMDVSEKPASNNDYFNQITDREDFNNKKKQSVVGVSYNKLH